MTSLATPDGQDLTDRAVDPARYLREHSDEASKLPLPELEALQLAALRQRFGELRDRIPVLTLLADQQGVNSVEQLSDAAPLLFSRGHYTALKE